MDFKMKFEAFKVVLPFLFFRKKEQGKKKRKKRNTHTHTSKYMI